MKEDNCAILARQSSSDETDDSLSIQVQTDACRALAAQKGLKVVMEEKEQDVSGRWYPAGYEHLAAFDRAYGKWAEESRKPAKARQGLGRILGALDTIAWIVVYDTTRLARPLDGSFLGPLLVQLLTGAKVKILSVKEGELDFSRFADRLVNTLSSSVNSEQIAIGREKAMKGFKRLKDAGYMPNGGGQVTGYRYDGKMRLVPVEREIEAVKFILTERAAGTAVNRICRTLNRKYAWKKWYLATVKSIIAQPLYAGLCRDSEGGLVKSAQVEAVVPYELWKRANAQGAEYRARPRRERKNKQPLSGLLVDGYTQERMLSSFSKGRVFWQSLSRDTAGARTARPINWVLKRGKDVGLREVLRPFVWPYFVCKYRAWLASRKDPGRAEALKAELDSLKDREAAVAGLILDGLLSKEAAAEKLKAGRARKAEIESSLLELSAGPTKEELFEHWNFIEAVLHERVPEEAYVAVMREAIRKITVWDERILIEGAWGEVELPRRLRKNRANFVPPALDAELSPEHVPGVHDPCGMKLVVKYVYGPGGERVLFDGPNFKVVKKG